MVQRRPASRGPIRPRAHAVGRQQSAYRCGQRQPVPKTAPVRPAPAQPVAPDGRHRRDVSELSSSGEHDDRRFGSSPSDSLRTPSIPAIASCTTLRSNGFIGGQPDRLAGLQHLVGGVGRERAVSSSRRACRWPLTSSISRLRVPVCCCTASRVSSCSASRVSPCGPTSALQPPPDDRDHGPVVLDVEVDVAVVVDDVEQPLEVVGGDVALLDQQLAAGPTRPSAARRSVPPRRPRRSASSAVGVGLGRVGFASTSVGSRARQLASLTGWSSQVQCSRIRRVCRPASAVSGASSGLARAACAGRAACRRGAAGLAVR